MIEHSFVVMLQSKAANWRKAIDYVLTTSCHCINMQNITVDDMQVVSANALWDKHTTADLLDNNLTYTVG